MNRTIFDDFRDWIVDSFLTLFEFVSIIAVILLIVLIGGFLFIFIGILMLVLANAPFLNSAVSLFLILFLVIALSKIKQHFS